MAILWGFLQILFGAFFIWVGVFHVITSMLPHDFAMQVAEEHGRWMREHVFHLPEAKIAEEKPHD